MNSERLSRRTVGKYGLAALLAGTAGWRGGTQATAHGDQGTPEGTPDPNGTPGTPGPEGTPELHDSTSQILLRIQIGGGLMPTPHHFAVYPQFTLYADGRTIVPGPMIEIFPQPALPNLQQYWLSQKGIDAVAHAAEDAGLVGESRAYANNTVADGPTTSFISRFAAPPTIVSVNALGLGVDDPSWSAEDREQIQKLVDFEAMLMSMPESLPEDHQKFEMQPYNATRLSVIAWPRDPNEETDPAYAQPEKDWPISTPLSAFSTDSALSLPPGGVCVVIDGPDAETLFAAAADSNVNTPWVSEGANYWVIFRPLLIDEQGCTATDPLFTLDTVPEETPEA